MIAGLSTGCGYNVVGSGYRDDPQVPLDTFVELVRAERRTTLPPAINLGEPDCQQAIPEPLTSLADPTEMLAAKLCVGDGSGIRIPADDLPALIADLRANQEDASTGACRAIPTTIVGITRWGDPFSLSSECGLDSYRLPGGDRYWNTSREIERLLENLALAD